MVGELVLVGYGTGETPRLMCGITGTGIVSISAASGIIGTARDTIGTLFGRTGGIIDI